jgi:hypothetical protein
LAHWLFNLILQGLKCKIKISEIYFDEKCDLSTCVKTRDYNILLSFYHYLQDNPYLQDNDSYPLLNFILNQIQTSKKRMSLIETLFLTHERDSGTINTDLSDAKEGDERETLKERTPKRRDPEEAITRNSKREKHKKKGRRTLY